MLLIFIIYCFSWMCESKFKQTEYLIQTKSILAWYLEILHLKSLKFLCLHTGKDSRNKNLWIITENLLKTTLNVKKSTGWSGCKSEKRTVCEQFEFFPALPFSSCLHIIIIIIIITVIAFNLLQECRFRPTAFMSA